MEENNIMTEEIVEKTVEAAENAVAAVTDNSLTTSVAPKTGGIGKELAIGGAGLAVGGIAGYCLDRWVVPKVKKVLSERKEKRARKKEEKNRKKAVKDQKAETKATADSKPEDGVDPMEVEAKID